MSLEKPKAEPSELNLDRFPQRAIVIPTISGVELHKILLEQGVTISHNVPSLLDSMPQADQQITTKLVQLKLGNLGFTYEYGLEGLKKIASVLKRHGMDLCPQLTGPTLAMFFSDFITGRGIHVLSQPITSDSGHELIYILGRGENDVGMDAYMIGALYHDTPIIASIANTT
jgi:hypothetical protein